MADNPDVRIGTAEREQALSNLSQHLSDGRLTLPEFDERSAVVTAATTRGELDSVFTDLPTPSLAPTASRPLDISKSAEPAVEPAAPAVVDGWDWRKATLAAAPIVALILFFVVPVSNSWLFFLLIPLTGALLFGGDRSRRRDR
ncbi:MULTISPECIES: DUF1707 SHOCT-like domain-containing protein [Nocardiaceae]|jgi:hypothetical protein|uniref:DUF1707 SHOCT-like domain-containing protein n=1 Tax=Nocardiaceae TaxID=85025 RepID=UPI0005695A00|nr:MULTISPECIES: DUF1707 domain-containing protein [Rhodococcus]OZF07296.1 DUF1707 domain-containing protein [Rhodococcus sp. 15-1189-1-1a]OZF22821.1 DUF1707 domain-containing protein [Rhodococcus sp. 14-2686-1-2]OZF58622.1 DUF1707 domain-containing protein [Rhodococcus sp. 14-2470-1b]